MKKAHVSSPGHPQGRRGGRRRREVSTCSHPAQAQLIEETPPRPGPDWLDADGRPATPPRCDRQSYRREDIFSRLSRHAISRDGRRSSRTPSCCMRPASTAFSTGVDLSAGRRPEARPAGAARGSDCRWHRHPARPASMATSSWCPRDRTPRLLGQPVAMLIYRDFARYRCGRSVCCVSTTKWCVTVREAPIPSAALWRLALCAHRRRHAGRARTAIRPIKDTVIFAGFSGDEAAWPKPGDGDAMARGMTGRRAQIEDIDGAGADTRW